MADELQQAIAAETERNVDVVFCIDGTGSMGPLIENVKKNIKKFKDDLLDGLLSVNTKITSLRTKVIVFRDYGTDDAPMEISDFFDLTTGADEAAFTSCVNGITAYGGGDEPENGLEALFYAMTSDFNNKKKDRQVIVLFTDTDALALKERASSSEYPADMVDMTGLQTIWSCTGATSQTYKLGSRQKRLVMFAPENTVYDDLSKILDNVMFTAVDPATGLEELNFDDIVKTLIASVSGV